MSDSPVYRPHLEAPARATYRATTPRAGWNGLETRDFEFVSRGDFVSGCVALPEATTSIPAPLILLTHGTGESAASDQLTFAADWVRRGLAVATIDLPLHGHRASPKLSERLIRGIGALARGDVLDLDMRALVEEFARQSTSDLIRAIDALGTLPEVDADRIALMGVGIGATASAYALAHDERPRACVLARGTGRLDDAALDPARLLGARKGEPACALLIMALTGDVEVSPSATRALFEAARAPKEFAEFETKDSTLPRETIQRARDFLIQALDL
jgi:dienelactone hydrolase